MYSIYSKNRYVNRGGKIIFERKMKPNRNFLFIDKCAILYTIRLSGCTKTYGIVRAGDMCVGRGYVRRGLAPLLQLADKGGKRKIMGMVWTFPRLSIYVYKRGKG